MFYCEENCRCRGGKDSCSGSDSVHFVCSPYVVDSNSSNLSTWNIFIVGRCMMDMCRSNCRCRGKTSLPLMQKLVYRISCLPTFILYSSNGTLCPCSFHFEGNCCSMPVCESECVMAPYNCPSLGQDEEEYDSGDLDHNEDEGLDETDAFAQA